MLLVAYKLFVAPLFLREPVVRASTFSLPTLERSPIRLSSRPGHVVFLDFWASWCPPCRASLPLVERFARAHPDVEVIAVDVGEAPAAARAFAQAQGIAGVALDGDKRVSDAFGVVVLPTIVAIDPAGYVRARWTGFNPAIELALEHARQALGPTPPVRKPASLSWIAPASAAEPRPLSIAVDEDPSSLDTVLNTPYGWLLVPRYDPAAARAVLAPRHLQLELAIAGSWRSSNAAAVQLPRSWRMPASRPRSTPTRRRSSGAPHPGAFSPKAVSTSR